MLHSYYTVTLAIFQQVFYMSQIFFNFFRSKNPAITQRSQKGDWVIKRCVLVECKKISKMIGTEGRKPTEYLNGGQNNGTF